MIILETERLIVREWEETDLENMAAFLQDPEVMYAYDHPLSNEEVTQWLVWNKKSYKEEKIGLWALVDKLTGEIVGECGLTKQKVKGETYIELGYHLQRDHWGQGYIMEAATAVMEWGFSQKNLSEIAAIIRWDNIKSLNVAIRTGFIIQEQFDKIYSGQQIVPHFLLVKKKMNTKEKNENG